MRSKSPSPASTRGLADTEATASVAGQTALALAADHRCRISVEGTDRRGGHATAGGDRRGVICFGREVITASRDCQRWVAAHEVAHLVHRHRRHGIWPALSTSLMLLLTVAVMVTVVLGGAAVAVAAGWVVAVAQWIVVLRWSAPRTSREEFQADDQATDWGFPTTAAIAEWVESGEPVASRRWPMKYFRDHPLPQVRAARQQARLRRDAVHHP